MLRPGGQQDRPGAPPLRQVRPPPQVRPGQRPAHLRAVRQDGGGGILVYTEDRGGAAWDPADEAGAGAARSCRQGGDHQLPAAGPAQEPADQLLIFGLLHHVDTRILYLYYLIS